MLCVAVLVLLVHWLLCCCSSSFVLVVLPFLSFLLSVVCLCRCSCHDGLLCWRLRHCCLLFARTASLLLICRAQADEESASALFRDGAELLRHFWTKSQVARADQLRNMEALVEAVTVRCLCISVRVRGG